jgi:hypothetical protein
MSIVHISKTVHRPSFCPRVPSLGLHPSSRLSTTAIGRPCLLLSDHPSQGAALSTTSHSGDLGGSVKILFRYAAVCASLLPVLTAGIWGLLQLVPPENAQ